MRTIYIYFILTLIILSTSCDKQDEDITIIEGVFRDNLNGDFIKGVHVSIDALKPSANFGISFSGYRKIIGTTTSDHNGHYKIKCRIPKDAENLEFRISEDSPLPDYKTGHLLVSIDDIFVNENNTFDIKLNPTALLKIKFKNTNPFSNSDLFYLTWYGGTSLIKTENCGTVLPDETQTWIGMDVCGIYTINTVAEANTEIHWSVKKNNETKVNKTNIVAKRGEVTEYTINY